MTALFHICSADVYKSAVENGTELMQDVRGYEPIYSPDGKEVLVTGYGVMTSEQVKIYTSLNWYSGEGDMDIIDGL